MYETIDVDNDLVVMLSQELSITPSNEHNDLSSQHGPCLELASVPYIVLDFDSLISLPPSLNYMDWDRGKFICSISSSIVWWILSIFLS